MTQFAKRFVSSRARWLLMVLVVVGAAWGIRHFAGVEDATAKTPPAKQVAQTAKSGAPKAPEHKQPIVALINGQTILRDELAKECTRHYGEEVLQSLANRYLIDNYCRERGVTVSKQEIDEEIDRIARKFALPKDQYLQMLEKERGIKPQQYGIDIVWPTLALRKLASAKLTVSAEELEQAYESQFGPAVKTRMIVLDDKTEAQKILALAKAKPEEFGALARNHSKDINSASSNGLIQPIRRHLGDPAIEDAAFRLKPGQISSVIPAGEQFVILKCEELVEPVAADRKQYDSILTEAIKDRKLRAAAAETFKSLQESAKIVNVMNDPVLSKKHPGVAATVNGQPITLVELGEYCVERHGKEVLEGTINRCLLEQSLKRRRLSITDADIDEEIQRAAISMGQKDKKTGKPDVEGWLTLVTEAQGISRDVYLHDVVWPSAAMKKIVGDTAKVTDDDMKKGFESNYGPRVRCRAIVFNNQRKAQEVWDMARNEPTVKNFAKLAEQYSIEANSRSLGGEIPPIQKWSGQKVMEDQAFSMQPGEVSGVIQVGQTFVVLFCEGYTKPVNVDPKSVQDQLYADILEKKQRLAMADTFEKIKAEATIDNYLAGTTQSSSRDKEVLEQDALLEQKSGPRGARKPDATVRSGLKR